MRQANLDPFSKKQDGLPMLPDLLREDTKGWRQFESGDQLAKLHPAQHSLVVATDGSLRDDGGERPTMGAGIYPRDGHNHIAPTAKPVVGEYVAFYPEAAAVLLALTSVPATVPMTIVSDCAVLLYLIESMTRATFWRAFDAHRYAGVLLPIMDALAERQSSTTFFKVKAHCGQLLNERADYQAVLGSQQDPDQAISCSRNPKFRQWEVEVKDLSQADEEKQIVFLADVMNTVQTAHLERYTDDPKMKMTTTHQRLTTPGLGHSWRAQVITSHRGTHSLPDHVIRRVVKQLAGQFPSNKWLHTIGKRDNPYCDICTSQLPATVGHIQCDCTSLANARTKAHNMIWDAVWETLLKQTKKQGWQGFKETPINLTGWLGEDSTCRLQPDGILYKEAEESRQVLLLDLTRCRGYDTDTFQTAAQQKEIKYDHLATALEQFAHEQGLTCSTRILALPIGHTGNISQLHWEELATTIDLKESAKKNLYKTATTAGIHAFSFMISMWKEAGKNNFKRQGTSSHCSVRGDNPPSVDRT